MLNCNIARTLARVSLTILLPLLPPACLVWTSLESSSTLQAQEVLTNESILKMLAAGFNDAIIIATIEQEPGKYSLGVDAMIALRQGGVSDNVIQAMLRRVPQPGLTPSPAPPVIPDGTVVKLRLKTTLSSDTAVVGSPVPVELAEDVVVGGVVVATRETVVPTVVKTANPATRFHGAGKLELEFQHLVLADGTNARLRLEKESTSNKPVKAAKTAGKALAKVSVGAFGAVTHGKEAVLNEGLLVTARVDGSFTFRGPKPGVAAVSGSTLQPAPLAAAPPVPARAAAEVAAAPSTAGGNPQAPRLRATFFHDPPRIELSNASGVVVASHPLLKDYTPPRIARREIQAAFSAHVAPVHVTSPSGSVLYVLQRSLRFGWAQRIDEGARISAFDLNTGAEIGNTAVSMATETLQFTSDDSRLIGFGPGHPVTKELGTATLTVLDPSTLQIKFVQTFGSNASMMHYIRKLDRMLVIDARRSTMWLVDPLTAEAPPIHLGGPTSGSIVSSDGTRLLTLVRNTNKSGKRAVKGGALTQFDVATGQLLHTSDKLGDAEQLIRLGDGDEYWVLMRGRMQRVTHEGEPTNAIISYEAQDKELGQGLGGRPGSSLAFGKRYAIGILKFDGSLAHKVAFIDPEIGRVESVTPVGRPGVRRSKTTKRWAIALALSAASGAAGGAASAATHSMVYTPVFVPGNASQVSDMVVSHDEKTVYVMDAESDDVTAVKSDGTVAAILPAKCGDSARLWKPSKGPFVYHFGKSAVTVIDTADNKVSKEIPIERGFAAMRMSKRNEFYLCDKVSCDVWDAVTASALKMDRQGLSARLAHADEPAEDAETADAADPAKAQPAQTEPAETASAAEPAKP